MASFRRSLALNFASSSGATAIQFLVSLAIARILSPAEIGFYSIAVVLVSIAHVFRDFGVSTYLQREDDLTEDKVRSAIGVAFAVAWAIALVLLVGSGCAICAALIGWRSTLRPGGSCSMSPRACSDWPFWLGTLDRGDATRKPDR